MNFNIEGSFGLLKAKSYLLLLDALHVLSTLTFCDSYLVVDRVFLKVQGLKSKFVILSQLLYLFNHVCSICLRIFLLIFLSLNLLLLRLALIIMPPLIIPMFLAQNPVPQFPFNQICIDQI